jgi:hypothetical protein
LGNGVEKHTVTFFDYDATVLKAEAVNHREPATPPTAPRHTGYAFAGWDKDYTNITADLDITATYLPDKVITVDFIDPNFLADVRRLIGKPAGEIYLSEVSHINVYTVQADGIVDFAGIENFITLESFIHGAHDGMVERLDVSHNLKLRVLGMPWQRLETLDLSSNSMLEAATFDFNRLETLHLPTNSSLTHLSVAFNRLAGLDLAGSIKLEHLDTSANPGMKSLDLTNNASLAYLSCWNNGLAELDVSNNAMLRVMNVSNNSLAWIDLSRNIALESLNVSNNPGLTAIDLSGNAALHTLNTSESGLSSLNLAHNTALQSLICMGNGMDALDLAYNTELVTLDARNNNLTALDLSRNTKLEGLHISNNSLSALDLSNNPALHTIQCSGNALAELELQAHAMLFHLDVRDNMLTALNLSQCASLHELLVSGNSFGSQPDVVLPPGATWGGSMVFGPLPSVTTFLVTFVCHEGTVLSVDEVEHGASATPPGVPAREGFEFIGWDADFASVTIDMDVVAVYSPIITSSFADPAFLGEVRIRANKPTGEILKSDVEHITSLIVVDKGISDLSGIEHFAALEELDCQHNMLTGLDLSQNAWLAHLNCSGNYFDSECDVKLPPGLAWGGPVIFGTQRDRP